MAENSKIQWTTHTFNPWYGCTNVSPGCDNCYAEHMMDTRMHKVQWGAGKPRVRTSAAYWQQPLRWNRQAETAAAGWRAGVDLHGSEEACIAAGNVKPERPRVFCASLADVFDNEVPQEWRLDLYQLIEKTPQLDWLLLTKRIGNAKTMFCDAHFDVPRNVWIGATVVNQEEADRDIPKLLATPAAVWFLSIEPILADIDLSKWIGVKDGHPAQRGGLRVSGGTDGRTGDRRPGADLARGGEARGSMERRDSDDQVSAQAGGARKELSQRPRDDRRQASDGTGASTGVASLPRANTCWPNDQPQERREVGQPAIESRAGHAFGADDPRDTNTWLRRDEEPGAPRLSWVIVGGESGPNARPTMLGHIEHIVEQCRAAAVPVFVKQVGSHPYAMPHPLHHPKGGDPAEWPESLRVRQFPTTTGASHWPG